MNGVTRFLQSKGGRSLFKRIIFYLVGLLLIGLGNALIIHSHIGSGPFDALFVGLNKNFGLTIGTWGIIGQIFIILLTSTISKSRPKWESSITILFRGIFFDFWYYIALSQINFELNFLSLFSIFLLGLYILGWGTGAYLVSNFPKTPVDGLMFAIHKKNKLSLRNSRIFIDTVVLILALYLGGPVGLGTIIIALVLGRLVQFSNKQANLFYEKIKKNF